MEYTKALSQISEIHAQLAKQEVYRGFRSVPVALSGVVGLAAAAVAPRFIADGDLRAALRYWVTAGFVCGLVGCAETGFNYFLREDEFARRRSRKVMRQFVPGLFAGIALAWCIAAQGVEQIALLPGLWGIVFGLAIFSARPYLPRASGWVALWYLGMGSLWVRLPPSEPWRFGWVIAGTFGAGQLAAALVLFWNVERQDHE